MKDKQLKKVGLKVTGPRIKILQILEDASEQGRHLSAEAIYQNLLNNGDEVGLATVYRVLTQFEQSGLVIKHNFEGEQAIYELDNGEHHDHLVCVKCGKVIEFFDEELELKQQHIANQHNFTILNHTLYLFGTCQECS